MSPRLDREAKRAETRRRLISAATRAFAQRGYEGASVEQIAEDAGYSFGAVYSNFRNKGELFIAVFEEHMARLVDRLAATREDTEGSSFPERARALADQWMATTGADRDFFLLNLEFVVHAARNPELSEKLGTRGAATRIALDRWMEAHEAETGVAFPFPRADLALIITALGLGLSVERLNEPDAIRDGVYGDFVAFLFTLMEKTSGIEVGDESKGRAE